LTTTPSGLLEQSFITPFVIRLEDPVVGIRACQEIWLDGCLAPFNSTDMMSMVVAGTKAMPIAGEGF
jgi:hypothetical protein